MLSAITPNGLFQFTDENNISKIVIPPVSRIGKSINIVESDLIDDTMSKKSPARIQSIVNPYAPYSYENMLLDSAKLYEAHPDIIQIESIGKSVEGRDLILIKLG